MADMNPAKIVTGKVRLSYVNVFQPQERENADPRYSVAVLIPKTDTATVDKFNKALEAVKMDPRSLAKWNQSNTGVRGGLRDGDTEKDDDAYKGHWFFNANSAQKPGAVDADLNPIMDPAELYSGCYGRVSVTLFAYNMSGSKGIGVGLNNVQKLEDGDRLGGGTSAESDFAL